MYVKSAIRVPKRELFSKGGMEGREGIVEEVAEELTG